MKYEAKKQPGFIPLKDVIVHVGPIKKSEIGKSLQTASKSGSLVTTSGSSNSSSDDWYAIFRKFGAKQDGFIPWQELKRKLESAGESAGLTEEETERLLRNVDKDENEKIDYSEFCFLMAKAKRMHLTNIVLHAAQMVMPRSMRDQSFNYLKQYNCLPPPLFIPIITTVQLAVYIYYVVVDPNQMGVSISGPVPVESPLIYNPHRRVEGWRFITYMLIHIGIYHIAFNCMVQLVLGIPLEVVHKYWRVCLVYLAGVVAGSLASSVTDPLSYLAGASGGVYALLSAHGAHLVVNWTEMEYAVIRLIALLIITVADVGVASYNRYYAPTPETQNISYAAHLGGFITGLLMGIVVLRNFRLKSWERVVWWIALIGCIILFLLCILWNIFYRQFFMNEA